MTCRRIDDGSRTWRRSFSRSAPSSSIGWLPPQHTRSRRIVRSTVSPLQRDGSRARFKPDRHRDPRPPAPLSCHTPRLCDLFVMLATRSCDVALTLGPYSNCTYAMHLSPAAALTRTRFGVGVAHKSSTGCPGEGAPQGVQPPARAASLHNQMVQHLDAPNHAADVRKCVGTVHLLWTPTTEVNWWVVARLFRASPVMTPVRARV